MHRHLVALAGLVLAFATFACGGGGHGDSKTYAPTVVPIKHIDFTGVELNLGGPIAPQFLDRYPAVVVTVNGESITGQELVSAEYIREANKRQALDPNDSRFSPKLAAQIQADDPLEGLIYETLKRQAVKNLGYLPSHQEAVDATRKEQKAFEDGLSNMSPEDQATAVAANQRSGYPEDDWTKDDRIVEGYRQNMGLVKLEREECPPATIGLDYTPPDVPPTYRSPCTDFLAKERKNAKIVYYVRWTD